MYLYADDLFEIANSFNNSLLMIQEKNIDDVKKRFTVKINLPMPHLISLDEELYRLHNKGNSSGFVPSEEIRATIMGLNFVIVPDVEEEQEEEK